MKINAIHKSFGGNKCIIKPVFFPKEIGLEFKVISGDYQGSIFACKKNQFEFTFRGKAKLILVIIAYYFRNILGSKLFRQYPYKLKCLFRKKSYNPDLPF